MTDRVDSLVHSWLTFSQAAAQLGLSSNKVRQMAREHQVIAVRTPSMREPAVPADCLLDSAVVKGLSGTLHLLADHGFSDVEAVEWLFTPDETLPGRPIDALRENRGTEVRRRAQALV